MAQTPIREPAGVPGAVGATAPSLGSVSRRPLWLQVGRRFVRHRLALTGGLILLLLVLAAVLAPWVAPYKPDAQDLGAMLVPPSPKHWMGTDDLGRDLLSRVIYGGRISLAVGFFAMVVAILVGGTVGAVAGFAGGLVDNLLMRVTDAALSIPYLFVLLVLSVLITPSTPGLIVIIGLTQWMYPARILRAEFLSLKQREFVEGARALGAPTGRIILRHILPNALSSLLVNATLAVGQSIIIESVMSWLGLGIQPPTASWGSMLSDAQTYVTSAPWLALFPGLMIFLTVLSFNLVGDGLRDALDPNAVDHRAA
ncbi:MAG: ABC transporter permease [Bacillota bacterium]|nr:ABC transporter permease [Bacillota bacterium]